MTQKLKRKLGRDYKAEGEKDKSGFFRIKKLTHRELAARTGNIQGYENVCFQGYREIGRELLAYLF